MSVNYPLSPLFGRRGRICSQSSCLPILQVFQHRKYGYKGVIYGWERTCEREQAWNDTVGVDPNQPFYEVLPDEDDCLRLFGGVRLSKYVAQVDIPNCLPLSLRVWQSLS